MDFIFSHFNTMVLVTWVIFFIVVLVRIFRPIFIKSVPYKYLVALALSIHLLYGVLATWLTYIAWSAPSNATGKLLLASPFPKEAPMPVGILEPFRFLFDGAHGYFALYSFFHYFLMSVVLFAITAVFVLFFRMYEREHKGCFEEGDMYIIALAFLMSGYAGSIVLIPVGFIIATLILLGKLAFKKSNHVSIPVALIVAAPLAFIYAIPLLSLFGLWPLLKL